MLQYTTTYLKHYTIVDYNKSSGPACVGSGLQGLRFRCSFRGKACLSLPGVIGFGGLEVKAYYLAWSKTEAM